MNDLDKAVLSQTMRERGQLGYMRMQEERCVDFADNPEDWESVLGPAAHIDPLRNYVEMDDIAAEEETPIQVTVSKGTLQQLLREGVVEALDGEVDFHVDDQTWDAPTVTDLSWINPFLPRAISHIDTVIDVSAQVLEKMRKNGRLVMQSRKEYEVSLLLKEGRDFVKQLKADLAAIHSKGELRALVDLAIRFDKRMAQQGIEQDSFQLCEREFLAAEDRLNKPRRLNGAVIVDGVLVRFPQVLVRGRHMVRVNAVNEYRRYEKEGYTLK